MPSGPIDSAGAGVPPPEQAASPPMSAAVATIAVSARRVRAGVAWLVMLSPLARHRAEAAGVGPGARRCAWMPDFETTETPFGTVS